MRERDSERVSNDDVERRRNKYEIDNLFFFSSRSFLLFRLGLEVNKKSKVFFFPTFHINKL
jgi:hypothetical protein